MTKSNNLNNYKELFDYKLHLSVFIIFLISQCILGEVKFQVFGKITIIILPLIYALIISIILYKSDKITWITIKQSKKATIIMIILIGPLIAKLAVISGQNIELLIKLGPAIMLEQLGDLGAIVMGLPVAILLGFKRESIGMTSSICKEPQMAVIIDKYGFDRPEVKGFMMVYIIAIVLGTVIISIIVPLISYIIPLHPYSYAIACAIGSTSMNMAGISALNSLYPQMQNQLMAFTSIANIISIILSIYIYMFISLPLTQWLYEKIEEKIQKE